MREAVAIPRRLAIAQLLRSAQGDGSWCGGHLHLGTLGKREPLLTDMRHRFGQHVGARELLIGLEVIPIEGATEG
jgi:hypothetical protein